MRKPTLASLEKSMETGVLWPPLADAVGTFIRRRAANADGYELTWRLIHVWEVATSILTGAVVTRLRSMDEGGQSFLRCREHLHGRTWDALSETFNRSQGALSGSATRRIDLLWDLENFDLGDSRFLESAKHFLRTDGIRLHDLVDSWKQICDVPPEIESGNDFTVRETFRHVNSFRNRFAHVPFPFDEMASLSERLLT
jgi:hypothetical protein